MYDVLFINISHNSNNKTNPSIRTFEQAGFYNVESAYNTIAASTLFEQKQYSLVIIDLSLSQSLGMELCRQIREKSSVPILLLGGSDDLHWVRKALLFQVSDYLPAPYSNQDLLKSMQTIKKTLDASAIKRNKEQLMKKNPYSSNKIKESIVQKVKQYVDETLHENVTLKEISSVFHFNCSYLGQKFKVHENMTFNEYLLQQRMEKAKFLLTHTDLKVYEVARQVGYTEIDWFYKRFKLYTGQSANAYRKKHDHDTPAESSLSFS